ncbi:uncharacterized protein SOCEGT47_029650 [Sorangium cellulosum]|uniref:Uncharacterized protein n=1 Tax=Sorangium cellulosum TaxID=56 RepID=A0A4V0NDF2_SORCE|nr:hypothetical protein [Sorangium cellulosum]AUX22462.1 uncharacterized protein SOCEGT47_029650 [Sorangium cellulosum]
MTRLLPRLDVLPAAQRALWPELACVPRCFVLAFNPLIAQKTLAYFEGGDLANWPDAVIRLLVMMHATRDIEVLPLPKLSERLD